MESPTASRSLRRWNSLDEKWPWIEEMVFDTAGNVQKEEL